jgi:hypothetical protein
MFEVLNSKLLVRYLIGPVAGFGASAEAEKSWGRPRRVGMWSRMVPSPGSVSDPMFCTKAKILAGSALRAIWLYISVALILILIVLPNLSCAFRDGFSCYTRRCGC